MNKSQTEVLAEFETLYTNAVKKHKKKLMRKVIGRKVLNKLVQFAKNEKIEISGGIDFEYNRPTADGMKHLEGTHWSSPFFQEDDHEMQFHTHVAYRRDRNTASCHPSPADMANVSLFYPGIILWENKEGNPQVTLLLSANTYFASAIAMEKAYDNSQNRSGSNISKAFLESWRASLNKAGMDFRVIDPLKDKIWLPLDEYDEIEHLRPVILPGKKNLKKGSLADVQIKYDHQKPFYCEKHKMMHRYGSMVYDRCAKRIGVKIK